MKRYLVHVSLEESPEIASALAAASISVVEAGVADEPGSRGLTLAVNGHGSDEALGEVRQALRRWGEIEAEVVHEEPL